MRGEAQREQRLRVSKDVVDSLIPSAYQLVGTQAKPWLLGDAKKARLNLGAGFLLKTAHTLCKPRIRISQTLYPKQSPAHLCSSQPCMGMGSNTTKLFLAKLLEQIPLFALPQSIPDTLDETVPWPWI